MRTAVFFLAGLPLLAQSGYYRFSVDQDRLSGAPDFSFLNQPIRQDGRIVVRDGHFYTAAGKRVRFFGVNLAFGANFPEPQDAARIARRLRRLGVNLVRLHHMDTNPDRDPANAGSTLTTGPYPTLNTVALTRLRGFLDALKAEGIYINLNLHVGYRFRPDVDKVPAMPDGQEIPIQSKPLHIFYPRMVELQTEYTRKLIGALRLKSDPVLAMVEINNESSLVDSWMRSGLKAVTGAYRAELERQWAAFPGGGGPAEGDTFIRFLADRDRQYLRAMLRAVRESTDGKVPVTGTQMGFGGLLNLDSHADLDYQDNHFYIDHYAFPHQRWDPRDWRIRDTSAVKSGFAAFLNMALAREAGRPYTVSEYNQPWPNRQAAEIDPTLAAFGAFQDWDGILHFAYSHSRGWENQVPGGFDINSDWTKWPNIGQSAWLFRSGVIQPGKAPVTVPLSEAMRVAYTRDRKPGGIPNFLKAAGIDPNVALVHPVGVRRQEGGRAPAQSAAAPYRSDTGQLRYDGKTYVIDTPKAAGVFGWPAGKVTAGAIDLQPGASARGFVTLLATALDDRPLAESRRMLVSIPGCTFATVPKTDPPRMQKLVLYPGTKDWYTIEPDPGSPKPSGNRSGGATPVWMERVESRLTLRSKARSLTVYPLDGAGQRMKPLAGEVERISGGWSIRLAADSPWYEMITR